jgi:hypothetical protein
VIFEHLVVYGLGSLVQLNPARLRSSYVLDNALCRFRTCVLEPSENQVPVTGEGSSIYLRLFYICFGFLCSQMNTLVSSMYENFIATMAGTESH